MAKMNGKKSEIRVFSKSFDDECVVDQMTRNGTLVISRISQILSHTHPPQPRSINIELLLQYIRSVVRSSCYNTSDASFSMEILAHPFTAIIAKAVQCALRNAQYISLGEIKPSNR